MELSVKTREVLGKKVQKLRHNGLLPANVYGHGLESVAIQIDSEDLEKTLKAISVNEVLDLKIAGEPQSRPVVIQKVQRHPLTSSVLHTDFYQVSLRERMRADVPLVVVGTSEGVETYNGVLVHALESLHIEALPLDLPSRIEVDITPLKHLEDTLHLSDLNIPPNVTVFNDPDVVVMKVSTPRVTLEEDELAAEEAEAAEEAAAEEGEAEAAEGEGEAESEESQ